MAKKQFKAESKRLLDLMINSIYTHKEIFLREIISNASDAIDKLCYLSLTDDKVGLDRGDFKIEITVDKDARTLTVSDNGIGMDKDELENNLGVIASSGSYKFRQEAEQKEDIDIIGQFGVGFYSAFMVADEITVVTKKYGAETAYRWQSSGADGYTVAECEKDSVGTDVIMHLKADTDEEKYSEYLDGYRLYELVKKYSDYIRYPIRMLRPTRRVKEGSDPEKPEYEYVDEMTTVNSMVPLWQRPRGEVTDEEYEKFYQSIAHAFDKPQRVITASVEGAVTYKALLFIPSQRPMDFYSEGYEKGLQLYSAGVMIMDHCDALLPDYLRFVRGVVDSPDLSLNISRELLQHDRQLKVIGNSLEKKLRADLEKLLRDDREGYEKFYENFGRAIGFGIAGPDWLHDTRYALPALMVMTIWRNMGTLMIIFLAGLQAIPEELKEAAAIDGAGKWRTFRSITLPLLKPTLLLGAVLLSVAYLQFFEESFVMTQGGPLDSTLSAAYYVYQKFGFGQYGIASAASWVLFIIIALVSVLQFRILKED